jgi:hypothetical protein
MQDRSCTSLPVERAIAHQLPGRAQRPPRDWTSPLTGSKEQKENAMQGAAEMAETVGELRAAEREVAREWQWLHDTLNEIARVRAERGDAEAFRRMQTQAMVVGQRRIELSMRIARLEGPVARN